jgi:hypothetical protein
MKAEIERNLMEQNHIDELVQEINELRDWAEECDNDYACEDMDIALDETIMFALQDMDSYERLELLKNALGTHALEELVKNFKETCVKYGIRENEDE